MEGFFKKFRQKFQELKNQKNDALRKFIFLLLAGLCLLIILWPADKSKSSLTDGNLLGSSSADEQKEDGAGETSDTVSEKNGIIMSGNGTYDEYIDALEEKLRQILANVKGVGSVEVMITLKDGGERIVEKDAASSESQSDDSSAKTNSETSVMVKDDSSNSPYISKVLEPEIEGVLISCEGASNPEVVVKITEAVQALFDVPAHKIVVLEQK